MGGNGDYNTSYYIHILVQKKQNYDFNFQCVYNNNEIESTPRLITCANVFDILKY